MNLVAMCSNLSRCHFPVDPFGYDKVDIPLEDFCETIEGESTTNNDLSF